MITLESFKENEIVALNGDSYLYTILKPFKKYLILESIDSVPIQKKCFFYKEEVSCLNSIGVYINEEKEKDTISLMDLLKIIKERSHGEKIEKEIIQSKNKAAKIFESFFPNYSREKVSYNNMKKIFKWYNRLLEFKKI